MYIEFGVNQAWVEDEEIRHEVEHKLEEIYEVFDFIDQNSSLVDFSGTDRADETTLDYLEDVYLAAQDLKQCILNFKGNQESVSDKAKQHNANAFMYGNKKMSL